MTTVDTAVTCAVLTVNVVLVCPAGTTTLNGTVASTVLLLASDTTAFPFGAADCSVTVAVEETPPVTVLGFSVTEETAVETTRNSVVLTVVPPEEAVTITPVVCVTGWVWAVKLTVVCPAGTVTLAGTVTSDVFPLESATTTPPLGAGPPSPTVPVAGGPPRPVPLENNHYRHREKHLSAADLGALFPPPKAT